MLVEPALVDVLGVDAGVWGGGVGFAPSTFLNAFPGALPSARLPVWVCLGVCVCVCVFQLWFSYT